MRKYNAVNKWNENWIVASSNKPQIRQLVIQCRGYNERMYYVRARKRASVRVWEFARPEHNYLCIGCTNFVTEQQNKEKQLIQSCAVCSFIKLKLTLVPLAIANELFPLSLFFQSLSLSL